MKWIHGISLKLFLVCFVFVLSSVSIISLLSYQYIKNETRANQLYHSNQMLLKVEQYLGLYYSLVQNTLFTVTSSMDSWKGDLSEAQKQL
ncbi:MAG TPA: hypothetical protein VGE40_11175, partial [Bacilli bacterium]